MSRPRSDSNGSTVSTASFAVGSAPLPQSVIRKQHHLDHYARLQGLANGVHTNAPNASAAIVRYPGSSPAPPSSQALRIQDNANPALQHSSPQAAAVSRVAPAPAQTKEHQLPSAQAATNYATDQHAEVERNQHAEQQYQAEWHRLNTYWTDQCQALKAHYTQVRTGTCSHVPACMSVWLAWPGWLPACLPAYLPACACLHVLSLAVPRPLTG